MQGFSIHKYILDQKDSICSKMITVTGVQVEKYHFDIHIWGKVV